MCVLFEASAERNKLNSGVLILRGTTFSHNGLILNVLTINAIFISMQLMLREERISTLTLWYFSLAGMAVGGFRKVILMIKLLINMHVGADDRDRDKIITAVMKTL